MLGPQQKHMKHDLNKYEQFDPNPDHLIPGFLNSKVNKARHFFKYYQPTTKEVNADLRKYYDPNPNKGRDNIFTSALDGRQHHVRNSNTYRSNISLGSPMKKIFKK